MLMKRDNRNCLIAHMVLIDTGDGCGGAGGANMTIDHRGDTDETRWNEELDTLTWPLLQAHIRQLAKLNFWLVKEDLSFSRRPTTFAWTTKWV